jgi:hypothetical protein
MHMGKIQELCATSVRPMLPAERLQLAKLILNDLAATEQAIDVSDEWSEDDLADVAAAAVRRADRSAIDNGIGNEPR